ncbi:hypothetical protein ACH9EU_00110, partial [Kocuria sp. M1R5S2]
MSISALRLPAAIAACLAVVLAGAPGASAAPASPGPDASAAATASPPATTTRPVVPVDDDLDLAGTDGTVRIDVLANDGLPDPAGVRLLLVDPEATTPEEELGGELATDVGVLRVVSPDTDPAELPEDWDAPGHPVLALEPDGAAAVTEPVAVGYAVVDPSGTEVRAVVTVTPEPEGTSTPTGPAEPSEDAENSTARDDADPDAATDADPSAAPDPETEPSADPEPSTDPEPSAGTDSAAAAAETDPNAHVPADVRAALEEAAARVAARSGEPTAAMRQWKGGWEWPHENGPVLWSEAHGAHFVQLRGAIGQKWLASGGVDTLGWPVADESCLLVGGGCQQTYSNSSTVYWTSATGARAVKTNGAIGHKWVLGGREAGRYGYPVTDERCGLVGGG